MGNLLRPIADSMPHWVKLAPNNDIEVLMQSTVQRPIVHLEPAIRLLQLPNTDFHTLKDGILDVPHGISHRYFQLDDFSLFAAFKGIGDGDMKARP